MSADVCTEYGEMLCPFPGCAGELILTRSALFSIYLVPEESDHFDWGNHLTDRWRVECTEDHVLMSSENYDPAEPFDLDALKALCEVLRPSRVPAEQEMEKP